MSAAQKLTPSREAQAATITVKLRPSLPLPRDFVRRFNGALSFKATQMYRRRLRRTKGDDPEQIARSVYQEVEARLMAEGQLANSFRTLKSRASSKDRDFFIVLGAVLKAKPNPLFNRTELAILFFWDCLGENDPRRKSAAVKLATRRTLQKCWRRSSASLPPLRRFTDEAARRFLSALKGQEISLDAYRKCRTRMGLRPESPALVIARR